MIPHRSTYLIAALSSVALLCACGSSESRSEDDDGPADVTDDTRNDDTGNDDSGTDDSGTDDSGTDDSSADLGSDPTVDPSPDTGPDFGDCSDFGFCTLIEPGCCQSCQELGLDDVVPVALGSESDFRDATCDDDQPLCPECAGPPLAPHFIAACESGGCVEYDVRESYHTECTVADDCRVMWADCCSCGPEVITVAEEHVVAYRSAICDPRADCPDCPTIEPVGQAMCLDGHCVLAEQ